MGVVSTIIPNSNLMIMHLDNNMELLLPDEIDVVAAFKLHVKGLALRHIAGESLINTRFPEKMNRLAG